MIQYDEDYKHAVSRTWWFPQEAKCQADRHLWGTSPVWSRKRIVARRLFLAIEKN